MKENEKLNVKNMSCIWQTVCSLVVYYKYFNGLCFRENAWLIPRRATVTADTRRQLSSNRFSVVLKHARIGLKTVLYCALREFGIRYQIIFFQPKLM